MKDKHLVSHNQWTRQMIHKTSSIQFIKLRQKSSSKNLQLLLQIKLLEPQMNRTSQSKNLQRLLYQIKLLES